MIGLAAAVRIATYLLAADGVAALALAGIIGPLGMALVGLGFVAALVREQLREKLADLDRLAPAVLAVAALASTVDLIYLADTVLDGLVHLLLFLVVARLCTLRSPADARVVAFLSFFMLVAASSASFGVSFLFVFLGYLLLTTWMLLLQHVVAESEPTAKRRVVGATVDLGGGRRLFMLAVVASVATLAISAVLFFIIPRVGLAALPFRGRMGPLVTGFSDRVELGAYGQIETDSSIAMRVHVPESGPPPDQIPDLRWRGIVFDEFDGVSWMVGQPERTTLSRSGHGPGSFRLAIPRGRGRTLYYEVYLEPIGTDIIFAAARVLRVSLRSDQLNVDDMDSLSVGSPTARLHYVVESELPEGPVTYPIGGLRADPRTDPGFGRYLRLPPLPARIASLAQEVTAGSRDPYQAAVRLTEHLAQQYKYTLALERRTSLDPVDEFLFVRRSGNCEYFAAALAVMLRSLGIPSRVVGGFQRGEWNPYGRYFTVRMRDAHSWVEAYIPGAGWVTLDPSPRIAAEERASAWQLYLDALRMRWYRYVINWSLRDQVQAAVSIRSQATTWRVSLGSLPSWSGWWRAAPAGLVCLFGLALVWLWRRERRRGSARAAPGVPAFYRRALRALARRGLRPEAGETAREFGARVAGVQPAAATAFLTLTATYERVRFGEAALTSTEEAAVASDLAELARAPASSPR